MGNYRVRAIPLDSIDTGENEVRLTLFSAEQGKFRVAVRGTKKVSSSLRPALDPLHEGHFYITERRTVDLLTEWTPVIEFNSLRRDMEAVALIGYMARFVLALMPSRNSEIHLYNTIKNIYFLLQLDISRDIIRSSYEWQYLRVAGVLPFLHVCAECGEEQAGRGIWLDMEEGAAYCERCRPQNMETLYRLGPGSVAYSEKLNSICDILGETQITELEKAQSVMAGWFENGLRNTGVSERRELGRALVRFCRHHLREDVPYWMLKLAPAGARV